MPEVKLKKNIKMDAGVKAQADIKSQANIKKTPRHPNKPEDNRRFKRRSVLWPAKLVVGRHHISCQIWNLSLGGARVRVDLPIKEGTVLLLSVVGRGDIPASVSWVDDEAMGLAFDAPAETIKEMFKDRLHILGLDESS